MKWEIDISIGPVQSFVNQSRRTRDLWGGSYLLSYLCCPRDAWRGGPRHQSYDPDMTHDALFTWVNGDRFAPLPRIGSVPNHFVVHSDEEPEALVAESPAHSWTAGGECVRRSGTTISGRHVNWDKTRIRSGAARSTVSGRSRGSPRKGAPTVCWHGESSGAPIGYPRSRETGAR